MEDIIKNALGTKLCERTGKSGGGSINTGESYLTDTGEIFIKMNSKDKARQMFDGEYASLKYIQSTNTIQCPKPILVFDNPNGGALFAMEYLDIKSLRSQSSKLGQKLAELHLHNSNLKSVVKARENFITSSKNIEYVEEFGFSETTCCGYLPQENTWCSNWVEFFSRHRLQVQLNMIEKEYGDREALSLWSILQNKIDGMFANVIVKPALLHGDLWGGNVGETNGEPVIFDPASFYGHNEYEMGIATMFGGFSKSFFDSYFSIIPKQPGYDKRLQLYQLFHYLNHWNHFGSGYRGSSIQIMKSLTK